MVSRLRVVYRQNVIHRSKQFLEQRKWQFRYDLNKKRMFYGKCNGTSNWRRMRRYIVKLEGLIREHTRRRRASMVFKCLLLLSVSVSMVFILHFYFVNEIGCVRCLHAFIHHCRQFPVSFGRFDGFFRFNQFLCHGQNIWIGSLHCKFSN